MKQNEFGPCASCGNGVGTGVFFYSVTVSQMVLDQSAIQRQHGLEMMMGQASALAQVLGPNEDLAHQLSEIKVLICGNCGIQEPVIIACLEETGKADG